MKQNFRRKLAWSVVPVMLAGGLAATGLASAQSTTTTSPQETTTTTAPTTTTGPTAPTPRVFFATTPTRILDTRQGLGQDVGVGGTRPGPLGAGGRIDLQVAGRGQVPANATAAAINVTVFGETQESFLTVWPTGEPQPGTSMVNPQPNLVLSQSGSVGLGNGNGQLSIYNAVGSTHVVVDLVGYYLNTSDVPSLKAGAHFLNGTSDPTPDVGVDGDVYINNTNNSLFGPKANGQWGPATRLGGTHFLTGTANPIATDGVDGDMYVNTTTNTLFGPKAAGQWGSPSRFVGAKFLTGTADPAATDGADGDMYINTTTNTLFGPKAAGVWGEPSRFVGAKFLTGGTNPTSADGNIGDMYINTATNTLFGPKSASGWGNGIAMGAHFTTGPKDPDPNAGNVGDVYLNTTSKVLYGPKTADGGWGNGSSLGSAVQWNNSSNGTGVQTSTFALISGSTLTLPPGKWFIQAKGNDNQSSQTRVDLRLQDTTGNTTLDAASVDAPGARIPFSLGGAVTLTAQTTYELQAMAGAAGVSIDNAKIFATQIGSINGS